jgi:hypothetical protein
MAVEITTSGNEEGYDTAYRAEASLSHLTQPCGLVFRHFSGGLCARVLLPRSKTGANQTFHGRVNGALRQVSP